MYTRDSTATSHQVVIHVVEVVLEGVGAGGGGQDAGLGVAEAPVQPLQQKGQSRFCQNRCLVLGLSVHYCVILVLSAQLWPLVCESHRALFEC